MKDNARLLGTDEGNRVMRDDDGPFCTEEFNALLY